MTRREGSKVFVNRVLENNPVPIIWTTNAVGNMDDAIIRRMSYVLKLDYPSRSTRQRVAERICKDEGVTFSGPFATLVESALETTTVLRNAARATKLAGNGGTVEEAVFALVKTLRGCGMPNQVSKEIDLAPYNTEPSLKIVLEGIAVCGHSDISLLLSGPPGTGKTAFAHQFAARIDKPLLTKRTSDLLSKWVGGTERNIAEAFADARKEQGVLFFDEADGLMFDRGSARASWEARQVNELLSWLDRHDQPVLAATLRRFDLKLQLKPLDCAGLAHAFRNYFDIDAPVEFAEMRNLTSGDFSVVKKQLHFNKKTTRQDITRALAKEAKMMPGSSMSIGFV